MLINDNYAGFWTGMLDSFDVTRDGFVVIAVDTVYSFASSRALETKYAITHLP
jgi:hypothetical protein